MSVQFYTYILLCADQSLYTGWTSNLTERVNKHNLGKGAKYTRTRLPVKLVKFWQFASKSEAMSWEIEIKKLSRQKKIELIGPAP